MNLHTGTRSREAPLLFICIIWFYIAGLIGFLDAAIMVLTGITSIGAILAPKRELLKL